MLLEDVKPFVRQAIISTISSSTKNDVFFELQSPDCRLFHIISGIVYIFYILKLEKVGKDSKNLIYYQLISMVKGRFFK